MEGAAIAVAMPPTVATVRRTALTVEVTALMSAITGRRATNAVVGALPPWFFVLAANTVVETISRAVTPRSATRKRREGEVDSEAAQDRVCASARARRVRKEESSAQPGERVQWWSGMRGSEKTEAS